ncbi:BTB/POZ domain-containing protein 19 isoform X6 [Manis javanica]|uniref:BTB/POZ domain-containing protein 19 isoform X6 n=1 Tax=Manis javanica TaxID=9974 RepID=UPI003C6D09C8
MPELMTPLPELPPPHLTSFGWDRTAPFQTSQFWALNTLLTKTTGLLGYSTCVLPCPGPPMEAPGLAVHGETAPFSTALRSLVNNPLYSDVCFVVGQEQQEVFTHRCLLACRCNFFQRLLGPKPGPGVPSPVVLSTIPAEAFLAVLEFLYTNSVKLYRHSVLEVLTAAVEYGLEELRELCLEFVVQVLDVDLVCEALQVAVTFGLGPLQERCIGFIEAHSQVQLPIFILPTQHISFCSSLTHSRTHRRLSGPVASWSCRRPRCCPCCAAMSSAWTRLSSFWQPGTGRAWVR